VGYLFQGDYTCPMFQQPQAGLLKSILQVSIDHNMDIKYERSL